MVSNSTGNRKKPKYSERVQTLKRITDMELEHESIALRQRRENSVEREEEVFNAVLDLPAQFRATYLTAACVGDSKLHSRIEALFLAIGQPIGSADAATKDETAKEIRCGVTDQHFPRN